MNAHDRIGRGLLLQSAVSRAVLQILLPIAGTRENPLKTSGTLLRGSVYKLSCLTGLRVPLVLSRFVVGAFTALVPALDFK